MLAGAKGAGNVDRGAAQVDRGAAQVDRGAAPKPPKGDVRQATSGPTILRMTKNVIKIMEADLYDAGSPL